MFSKQNQCWSSCESRSVHLLQLKASQTASCFMNSATVTAQSPAVTHFSLHLPLRVLSDVYVHSAATICGSVLVFSASSTISDAICFFLFLQGGGVRLSVGVGLPRGWEGGGGTQGCHNEPGAPGSQICWAGSWHLQLTQTQTGGGGLHGKVSLLLITLGLDVVVEKRESECSSLRICAPHCFLHQCACVCVRVKGGCACCVFIFKKKHLCPFAHVRVLFVLDGSTRCHVSPYTPSTVALAPGPFISLCAGLFIVSQALSQMCTATAPPAWLHMLCCATPSSLLLILLLFMCTSYREQLSKNILAPLNATGTRIRRSGGGVIPKGRGGGGGETEQDVNFVQA